LAWLDFALGLSERIVIQNSSGKREGVFEGIDADGRLLMRSNRGLERVEAADLRLSPRSDAPPPTILSASHPRESRA
jgi:biotin-(acetyl-CoA carboxylase) ligase